ncbi:ParB/RepB/Spo0J family partition protein [Actinomadura fibrosa]|uniref:ParB/RepB/Spo0J family partition protein n=2 Tax=Actinomadura fibrosa TaxID=111802 RepID=A0ABW2Y0W0_9ACTN|nr:ParB N-terminal domain-containing protein [Actinomadura fibrosa]
MVPLDLLRPGDSPRTTENAEHIRRLADDSVQFPPILVHRASMRIIDGHHRAKAAALRGRDEVEVLLVDGDDDAVFLRAVAENSRHGLPLSLPERRAAALRVLATHPDLSDRAIGLLTGLSPKTVGRLRRRSTAEVPDLNTDVRRGVDGRSRPVSAATGRRRAAEIIAADPSATLREIAKAAGVSVGTAHDVRLRVRRGTDPAPGRQRATGGITMPVGAPPAGSMSTGGRSAASAGLPRLLPRLASDPAVRQTETGRGLLRLLHAHAAAGAGWPAIAEALPPHCAGTVIAIARECARDWERLARRLEQRADGTR